ncbi:hypothetical protein GmHk_07G019609 [Glycine max]|nr:hypothetical protein GmHk_07G019609 [Glycine max]
MISSKGAVPVVSTTTSRIRSKTFSSASCAIKTSPSVTKARALVRMMQLLIRQALEKVVFTFSLSQSAGLASIR